MLDPLKTSSYDYDLPKELIASKPVHPADSAKLLVYNRETNTITHSTFKNLMDFLPEDISVFLNDTKVIKARIFGKKLSGGKVELLLNKPLFMDRYLVMIRGKVSIGMLLYFEEDIIVKVLEINEDGTRVVEFYQNEKKLDFLTLVETLNKIGHLPLPHYMNREDNEEDNTNYQTLFAKNYGAVAAPTASLHFTQELLEKINDKYDVNYLTLHVGAGTFKPVDAEDILSHPMHSEYFEIGREAKESLDKASKVLAVGTTVTRTIEYYARKNMISGECDLFLNPANEPIKVDHLLTNFHLPKSTLIMLIASFVGLEKTLEIYEEAIKEEYRFFSYGDGMLII
ncbi:tRNA preQ1(34) S-adenosylmethionine ribosyltransferase-isomerase QueA [Poseidonibacter ostreae]|jgi:S-adenosylmethionine:tRNA ribosyltransferase-isomerase|uniref:S-adenosylmethionine:tRNA ribosyltransferase-isomerase n=1 Tax=Poseidonibacter ostreae TaxID=2654171 RepID=A0A6L4WW22_9BACT|nr:tRNA preQ1(34) S-adenosylmethionine ribosyltransferase-isomerase QueA [Poseidonibacter ostreae]KAB7887336.1 tRNA preQ1(34) S-adenosylmethionine ribosyltransferase-isomerase QueA [Poseidonibacter ostreae]KAB7890239.1 tRNA preQ1(34) S-adenosylmethionine ribosyltransferase-isomerase QueA [Poseidonibacter ostreae]KAB7890819.1 tRNA preQ1(34) S-adenosylmethionine ribosyltransferase-isomerase QueA [Poseidonibacter ostreae]MAC84166.1 tRNA preQ1(34) S-adenosylmethionine ribosyltransferase-isomerase Q|tara:strand:- start:2435 stop:3457 length:1023 start_codon:yes stop_codon:yes gene_type:complete